GGFVAEDRHESLLGILFLDQILAGWTLNAAAEENAGVRVKRVDRHRIFRTEQLGAQPQSRADVRPRSRRFEDERVAVLIGVVNGGAREVFARTPRVIDRRT